MIHKSGYENKSGANELEPTKNPYVRNWIKKCKIICGMYAGVTNKQMCVYTRWMACLWQRAFVK